MNRFSGVVALVAVLAVVLNVWPGVSYCNDNASSGSNAGSVAERENAPSFFALPYAFYNEKIDWTAAALFGANNLFYENTLMKLGALVSAKGTKYLYFQADELYLPFLPRLYVRPDIYIGHFGSVTIHQEYPWAPYRDKPHPAAGTNDSDRDNHVESSGDDRWYELTFKYLLPIGHGKSQLHSEPVLRNGLLVGGDAGGTHWNPLKSGRTFLEFKPYYRKQEFAAGAYDVNAATSALEFALLHENIDYYYNPSRGSKTRLAFLKGWGTFDNDNPFTALSGEFSYYHPLHRHHVERPKVLAFTTWTYHTLSWNDYDWGTYPDGSRGKQYHRPQNFAGATLGGPIRFRAYEMSRYFDRSAIYHALEYRHILAANPFKRWRLTRNLGIDWIQLVAFAEAGRVAPEWSLSTLYSDMKFSGGGGVHLCVNSIVVRVDAAAGNEGMQVQMYYDQAF